MAIVVTTKSKMAESEDSNDNNIKKINIIIKTAKEKETIEVNENQSVKEVWLQLLLTFIINLDFISYIHHL